MPSPRVYAGAALLCGLIPAVAQAQTLADPDTDCAALPEPKLFIEAGDTQMRMIGDLARKLRDAEEPITLVYLPRSTCTGAENYFRGAATTETMRYVPSIAEDPAWTSSSNPRQCSNRAEGFVPDVTIGATFISSCSTTVQGLQPANVQIIPGPVQAYGFVVPEGSLEGAKGGITWDEAYYVFSGQGPARNVVPWNKEPNPTGGTPSVYIRGATTSTLLTAAANVAPELLPAASWVGYRLAGQEDRSSVVINGLKNSAPGIREAAIGIVGVDLYDRDRNNLDILAFQARGQKFGYYPDSSPSLRDKRNVRDGHYVPWSYTAYLVHVDGAKAPINPLVARLLDLVSGEKEVRLKSQASVTPSFDLDALAVVATNGLVPSCAMGVSRTLDGGDLSLFSPERPCGCFFETVQDPDLAKDPAWMQRCQACSASSPCSKGVCRRGYCEAR